MSPLLPDQPQEILPPDTFAKWWQKHCEGKGTPGYVYGTTIAFAAVKAFAAEWEAMAATRRRFGVPSDKARLAAFDALVERLGVNNILPVGCERQKPYSLKVTEPHQPSGDGTTGD